MDNNSITTPQKKPRIAFIDALRGFTMILVVYSHIQVFGFDHYGSFNEVFVKFRMPLFFFISGWVLYKATRTWDAKTTGSFLKGKFKVQIVSTAIFWALFVYMFGQDFVESLNRFKAGYWFTYTLFFYYLFYIGSMHLARLLKGRAREDVVVGGIAIVVLLIYCYVMVDKRPQLEGAREELGVYQWRFYIFFVFGTLVRKHYKRFVAWTDRPRVMATVTAALMLLIVFNDAIVFRFVDILKLVAFGLLGITLIYTLFRKNEQWFASNRNISVWLQYIGRHTLDIYLLHYFFVPRNLQIVGDFFEAHPNPTVEFFVACVLALAVIGVCLLVSKVLCVSPILAKLLFGKKQ